MKHIYLTILLVLSFAYGASEIPYEKCTWKNKPFTERLVNEAGDFQTEAHCPSATCQTHGQAKANRQSVDYHTTIHPTEEALHIPPECFFVSATRSVAKKPSQLTDDEEKKTKYANYYYCDSMNSSKSKQSVSTQDNTGKKLHIHPQPPCLNEDYIMMTYHSFHNMADCFGFSPAEKRSFFSLLNHESSFILNQKSNTGARCYGQLTTVTLTEINMRIYTSELSQNFESQIYRDFATKCPELLEQVHIPDQIRNDSRRSWAEPKTKAGRRKYSNIFDAYDKDFNGVRTSGQQMTCQLSQHADTCFFYAMYNMKTNQIQLEKTISGADNDFPQSADLEAETPKSQDFKQVHSDFQLPLKLNEMLIIRGHVTQNGKKVQQEWLMRDGREVYTTFYDRYTQKRKVHYDLNDLEVQKVTVFQFDEETQNGLLYQAYNGGQRAVAPWLRSYIRERKTRMSLGDYCKKNPNDVDCQKRKKLFDTRKPVPFDLSDFSKKSVDMTPETSNMPSQVQKHQAYLNDAGSQTNNPNPLTNHLYKLKGIKPKDPSRHTATWEEEKKNIDDFVDSMKDKCGPS